MKSLTKIGLAAAFALSGLGIAQAATITEASVAGGTFSDQWSAPTSIDAGTTLVSGTGAGGAFDILSFSGLPSGAQTVTLNFAAPDGIGYSYSAGGSVLYATEPFLHGWDGATLGTFHLGYGQTTQSLMLELADDFAGDLYLGLYFTYGSGISYDIALPSAAAVPAAVPVPAAGLLLAGALGAFGLGRAARAARRAGHGSGRRDT